MKILTVFLFALAFSPAYSVADTPMSKEELFNNISYIINVSGAISWHLPAPKNYEAMSVVHRNPLVSITETGDVNIKTQVLTRWISSEFWQGGWSEDQNFNFKNISKIELELDSYFLPQIKFTCAKHLPCVTLRGVTSRRTSYNPRANDEDEEAVIQIGKQKDKFIGLLFDKLTTVAKYFNNDIVVVYWTVLPPILQPDD
jgi:hypothetical protein